MHGHLFDKQVHSLIIASCTGAFWAVMDAHTLTPLALLSKESFLISILIANDKLTGLMLAFLAGLQQLERDPSLTSQAPRKAVAFLEPSNAASTSGANQWAFGRRAAGRGRRSAQEWVRDSNVADSTWSQGLAQYRPEATAIASLKSGQSLARVFPNIAFQCVPNVQVLHPVSAFP